MDHRRVDMKFVIWAPSFDDRSGGTIALHLLCQKLSDLGEQAMLWPLDRPMLQPWRSLRPYINWLGYTLERRHRRFSHGPFATRLAQPQDVRDAMVVYPEVVSGNPLRARHVVRWLLHRPGFHTGEAAHGADDLMFLYQDAFHDPAAGAPPERLTLTWWNAAYADRGSNERSGSAYLLKKGKGRPIQHDLTDSVLVDDLSHADRAAVFNRVRCFYTYDPYTLYSRYAAICGCIPVIVPEPGLSREAWVAREEERYGLAYGVDDVDWAIATRPLLLQRIADEQAEEDAMLRRFVARCRERFGAD